jgi:hypothetical protein
VVAEMVVESWQEHLKQCERCQAVLKLRQAALLYNLCSIGRSLYYPAWQADNHRLNPGAKS